MNRFPFFPSKTDLTGEKQDVRLSPTFSRPREKAGPGRGCPKFRGEEKTILATIGIIVQVDVGGGSRAIALPQRAQAAPAWGPAGPPCCYGLDLLSSGLSS